MVTSLCERQSSHRKNPKVYKEDTKFKEYPIRGTTCEIKTVVTAEDRRVRDDLIEVFKITHGYSSVTLETFFETDSAIVSHEVINGS